MPYSDFSTAYADWLTELNGCKTNWNNLDAQIPLVKASGSVFTLANRTGTALEYVRDCIELHIGNGFASLSPSSISHYMSVFYAHEESPGGTVDMASILTAMMSAKFEELQEFIGIVDAYRIALWNAPFNAEFYGALARGFIKWPQY